MVGAVEAPRTAFLEGSARIVCAVRLHCGNTVALIVMISPSKSLESLRTRDGAPNIADVKCSISPVVKVVVSLSSNAEFRLTDYRFRRASRRRSSHNLDFQAEDAHEQLFFFVVPHCVEELRLHIAGGTLVPRFG